MIALLKCVFSQTPKGKGSLRGTQEKTKKQKTDVLLNCRYLHLPSFCQPWRQVSQINGLNQKPRYNPSPPVPSPVKTQQPHSIQLFRSATGASFLSFTLNPTLSSIHFVSKRCLESIHFFSFPFLTLQFWPPSSLHWPPYLHSFSPIHDPPSRVFFTKCKLDYITPSQWFLRVLV